MSHYTDFYRSCLFNIDVIGVLRGRHALTALAVKLGEKSIRNGLRNQLAFIRDESLQNVGSHPLIFTEIGIPYDLDNKHAYATGDYRSQIKAMDANHFALEGSNANGFTLWAYVTEVCTLTFISRIVLTLLRMITHVAINGMVKTFQFSH